MASSFDDARVALPDNVMTRAVDGTLVLLDIDSGRSFTLDAIGARVWSLLISTGSVAATSEVLIDEFAADPAQLRADVVAIVAQLSKQGLLVLEQA